MVTTSMMVFLRSRPGLAGDACLGCPAAGRVARRTCRPRAPIPAEAQPGPRGAPAGGTVGVRACEVAPLVRGASGSVRRTARPGRTGDPRAEGAAFCPQPGTTGRSEEHTSELQSRGHLVCRLLLEKKKQT